MNWISRFLTSSLGQKVIMSLTGIFLILFLIVHMVGNLQLLANDGGRSFNIYAAIMSHNPIIKVISFGLYGSILLHALQGIALAMANRQAKGTTHNKGKVAGATWASKNMALLGILIFAFLCLHMGDFWVKMRFMDTLSMVTYTGQDVAVQDIYSRVNIAFQNIWIVIIYLVGVFALAIHLVHGFQSAFQSLGISHKKYTPMINVIGWIYTIVICSGFAIMPLYHYFLR